MTRAAEMNRPVIRAIFGAEQPGKVIDIRGGQGALINMALEINPRLTGLLFDLPEVVANAALNEGVAQRCEIVRGSFFETLPGGVTSTSFSGSSTIGATRSASRFFAGATTP